MKRIKNAHPIQCEKPMTDEQIEQAFQDAWEEFGDDASTEFLIGITADRCDCEYGDVVDALANMNAKPEEEE